MSNKKGITNIAIIGAGEESIPLLRGLGGMEQFKIIGLADDKKSPPGFDIAKELSINTTTDFKDLLKSKDLDLVIETSGSAEFAKTLEKLAPSGVKVMNIVSARLILELTKERERLLRIETAHKLTQRYSELIEESNRKLDEKVLELTLLNETSKTFSTAFDRRNVSTFIYDLLKRKIDLDGFVLLLVQEEMQTMVIVSDKKMSSGMIEETKLRMAERLSSLRRDRIDTDKLSILIERSKTRRVEKEELEGPIKTFSALPLVVLDKVVGLLGIIFCKEKTLTVEDERFFNILVGQVALFAENDRVKQALTSEKNRLESILKSMTEGIIVVDNEKRISLINTAAEYLLEISAEEVLNTPITESIKDETLRSLFDVVMGPGSQFMTRDIQFINTEGTKKDLVFAFSRIKDHLGEVVGTVMVIRDVTKEKEVDRLKSEFISTTSHELRTPLASIKEAISLILDGTTGPTNKDQAKFLDVAKRNLDRLSRLINSLLDLGRIESGKLEITRELCDINQIAIEQIATFKKLADDKNLILTSRLKKDLSSVYCDRDRISQVISNLISNAIKFTDKGQVTVTTSFYGADPNYVRVTVSDTGIGIEKGDFDKLFQRFHQLDSSLTRRAGGTGLGLAITKQIIDLHGGRIWVESEHGKGCEFTFILPTEEKKMEKEKKKIMVIDDEADLCSTVKARLQANNYAVETVLSGKEGLEKVKTFRPDLIILDLMMPEMDGYEVCKRLKKDRDTSRIPVVVLTCLEEEDSAKKALVAGAEGYIVKPFEQESLLFTVKEFLK